MAAGQSAAFLTRAYSRGKYVGQAWIVPSLVPGENGETSVVPVIQLDSSMKPQPTTAESSEPETRANSETTVYSYPNQYYYNTAVSWTLPYYYGSRPDRHGNPSHSGQPQNPPSENNTTVVPVPGNTPWMPASRVVPVQPPAISNLNNPENQRYNYSTQVTAGSASGFIPPSGQTRPQVLGRSAGSIKTYTQ